MVSGMKQCVVDVIATVRWQGGASLTTLIFASKNMPPTEFSKQTHPVKVTPQYDTSLMHCCCCARPVIGLRDDLWTGTETDWLPTNQLTQSINRQALFEDVCPCCSVTEVVPLLFLFCNWINKHEFHLLYCRLHALINNAM